MRMFRGYVSGEATMRSMLGRDFLVLPVVAFQAGVWHGMNNTAPEYTPERVLKQIPESWNGRPVIADHPTDDQGNGTSAGDPEVLDSAHMGWVFNARVEDEKLLVDAWVDLNTPAAMSENVSVLLDQIEAGEPIEVSIGAFVTLQKKSGTWNGQKYQGVWSNIYPDHLAFLSQGEGACSNEDGCGVQFQAEQCNDLSSLDAGADVSAETMDHLRALRKRNEVAATRTSEARPSMNTMLANGLFDRDVRTLLADHLSSLFNIPYVLAFSDDRVVFDALVEHEHGMYDVQIFVANYAIDADNQVSLTSEAEPAWLAVAPIPFNVTGGETDEGDDVMSTEKAAPEKVAKADCGCAPPPVLNSLEDVKGYLGDSPVAQELKALEDIRDKRRADLIAYIGDSVEGDLTQYDLSVLEQMATLAERERSKAAEKAEDASEAPEELAKPAYHGRAGGSSAPTPRTAPTPPKVFGTTA